jgi:hypothetical protein
MFHIVGDSIAVTPPLIVGKRRISQIFKKVAKARGTR